MPGVKGVAIAQGNSTNYIEATAENAASGKYPLGRYLYIYVNKPKDGNLQKEVSEFLKYVLSSEGQEVVKKHGFVPLPDKVITKSMGEL